DTSARFAGGGVAAPHAVKGKSPVVKCYVINASAEPNLASLRFRLKDVKFFAAEAAFESGGDKISAGTFVLPLDGNPADVDMRLNDAAKELGVGVTSIDAVPDVARHEVALPRIALMHTWTDTQNEGWFRLMMEEAGVPYTYISDQAVRDTANMRSKF